MKKAKTANEMLRALPSVDELLKGKAGQGWLQRYPRPLVLKAVRTCIEGLREKAKSGKAEPEEFEAASLSALVEGTLAGLSSFSLRPLINATGIVLHTNLGRAPLPESALQNVLAVSRGYSNLEYNLAEGIRGKRYAHLRGLLRELTGAEEATVVNNNAAAVLLALASLARGREVIVSRGELVEIGGSFRIPDVMAESGAVLREVGTTNKTHLRDYEGAIGPETALILKVHQSNYRMTGFVSDVPVGELARLGGRHSIPVMYDLGSGCLIDIGARAGLGGEPLVKDIVRAGADIVTFSGDKLLGGPQAGIILGRASLMERINKNPLARAVRIDKMTLAALEAVLYESVDEERAVKNIPTLRMLLEPPESIRRRAEALAGRIRETIPGLHVEVIEEYSEAGGGSLPGVRLLTYVVAVKSGKLTPNAVEQALRAGSPPVVARIREDALLLDARTIGEEEVPVVADCLKAALA